MTLSAFFLIFLSIFLHAGWNFISKSARPSGAFYLVVNIVSVLILLPFIFLVKVQWDMLPAKFWYCLAASVFFEFIYVTGLFQAYKRNDISMAYPMVRALPVLLVAILSYIFRLGATPELSPAGDFLLLPQDALFFPRRI